MTDQPSSRAVSKKYPIGARHAAICDRVGVFVAINGVKCDPRMAL